MMELLGFIRPRTLNITKKTAWITESEALDSLKEACAAVREATLEDTHSKLPMDRLSVESGFYEVPKV